MAHRVLLVGEKVMPISSLAAALRDNGFDVVVANSEQIAVENLAGSDVLVVLDSGLEAECLLLLKRIREYSQDLPVILIGRHCQVDVAIQALKLGRVEYLSRPISPRRLCDKIEDVLERQAYFDELARLTALQPEE